MHGPRDIAARAETDTRVDYIRNFNRFYTQRIGVLAEHLLNTPYTLTEARVLFEIGQGNDLTATDLTEQLSLDAGYLSRLLAGFEKQRLLTRLTSETDQRRRILRLTGKGQSIYDTLVSRARNEIRTILEGLPEESQIRLLKSMAAIESILQPRQADSSPLVIRSHRSGDIGWIIERHGVLYNEEYQWDETFEALVARILGEMIQTYDHRKDRIWIAEVDGQRAGTILAAKGNEEIVKLRLFLVEPWARGRGVGRLLIKEMLSFSRSAGYKNVTLWTQSCLLAARHLYENHGFRKVATEKHHSFGHDLIGETWELELT